MYQSKEDLKKKLFTFADAHKDEFFEELKALCRIDSTRGEPEEGKPYGEGPDKALHAMADLYEKYGAKTEMHGERGYALVRFFEDKKEKGLIGGFTHCDVVLPNGDWLITKPFEPVEKDGYLVGRGVKDDKGGGLLLLYAIRALLDCGYEFQHTYQGFLGANEETGFGCVRNYLADGKEIPLASISPDASFLVVPGENSKFTLFVSSSKSFENIKDFDHGDSKGMVCPEMTVVMKYSDELWEQLSAAAAGRTDADLEIAEDSAVSGKNGRDIVLKTRGKSVHIAAPHFGIHAGGIATEILLKCEALGENDLSTLKVMDDIFRKMKCEAYGCEFEDPFFGPTSSGMLSVKTVDGIVKMEGRLNYTVRQDTKEVIKAVKNYYNRVGWNCEITDQSDGYIHEGIRAELFQKITDNYTDINDGRFDKRKAFGATYARYIPNCISTGLEVPFTSKVPFLPAGHGGIHQPDECVNMEAFIRGIVAAAINLIILDQEV